MTNPALISIIIPANNESDFIGPCLAHLVAQDNSCAHAQVIVSANACTDDTVAKALAFAPQFEARGWSLIVLDSAEPGKLGALNRAEAAASASAIAYLDADVHCDADVIGQLAEVLASDKPTYATGTFTLMRSKSLISRLYGKFWLELPFMKSPAVGAGLFAVNAAGRARWDAFPDIISDDTFVRLSFAPNERVEVSGRYHWPLVEGFSRLVRVRRRQNAGVAQLNNLRPELFRNEQKPQTSILSSALNMPLAFCVYAAVQIAVKVGPTDKKWTRGR